MSVAKRYAFKRLQEEGEGDEDEKPLIFQSTRSLYEEKEKTQMGIRQKRKKKSRRGILPTSVTVHEGPSTHVAV